MSILAYPKHQFAVEVDGSASLLKFTLSSSGYLKHIRLKMLIRNYPLDYSYADLSVMSEGETVSSSERVYYRDISRAVSSLDYYHTLTRFDFDEALLVKDKEYSLKVNQVDYAGNNNCFVGYCLDYDYPINQFVGVNTVFQNTRLAAEIFILRDYYDFN